MAVFPYTIEEALPHAAPMILLDKVCSWTTQGISTEVTLRPSHPFMRPAGVPAHVSIELMAQACGAYAGVEALMKGRVPRVGLLLGTRNFNSVVKWLCEGDNLLVAAAVVFREDEMGVFDCTVAKAEEEDTLASARLTVYQPSESTDVGASYG